MSSLIKNHRFVRWICSPRLKRTLKTSYLIHSSRGGASSICLTYQVVHCHHDADFEEYTLTYHESCDLKTDEDEKIKRIQTLDAVLEGYEHGFGVSQREEDGSSGCVQTLNDPLEYQKGIDETNYERMEIYMKETKAGSPEYSKRAAISEEMQQAVLNVHEYLCKLKGRKHGAILETSKALKIHRHTVDKIVKRGSVEQSRRGQHLKGKPKFSKIDDFWKELILQTIYNFDKSKGAPTLDSLLAKLIEISSDSKNKFPYGRTTLWSIVKMLGFEFKKVENRYIIVETVKTRK